MTFELKTPACHPKYQKTRIVASNQKFREILPSNGWRPGPIEVDEGGQKVLYL